MCPSVDWPLSDRRCPREFIPVLATVGMVESETDGGGAVQKERGYCLCSSRANAANLARMVRGHWGIGNRQLEEPP
jgi:hypothetical protein